MRLSLLVNNQKALQSLSVAPINGNAQIAWDLSEEMEKVEKALEKYFAKRDELIKKYGEPEREEGKFFIKDTVKFEEELAKVEAVDIKVSFPKITLQMVQGAALSASDIRGLKDLKILSK